MKYHTILSFVLVYAMCAGALQVQETTQAQLLKAMALYNAEQIPEAVRTLKEAYKNDKGNIDVVRLLGQIECERERWGDAKDWLDKVLDLDPDDILAQYYAGISYRETGKYKAFILRRRDWSKAENFFTSVIDKDPGYRDVLFQFALLQRYRNDFYDAITLAERQLSIDPANVKAGAAIYEYYDGLLFHEKAEDVKKWLATKSAPVARFYFADLLRRQDHITKADSIMTDLDQHPDSTLSRIPLYLSMVRLGVQQNDGKKAQLYYQKAVDAVKTLIDAAIIFEDVKYVMSDEELSEWEKIKDPGGKKEFLTKMWIKRNPMPAADLNYRLVAHFERLVEAEKYYRFDGFRNWMSNPDKLHYLTFPRIFSLNDKFNDKGVVYIRHGEPNDRAFDVGANAPQNESWLYYRSSTIEKNLIFHFIIDEYGAGNNWRLTAVLPKDLMESRLGWDPIFNRMYTASPLEMLQLEMEMAKMSRENVMTGLNTDRHTWAKEIIPIYFPFYVASFKTHDHKIRNEIYYSLKSEDIWPKNKNFSADTKVDLGFSVFDLDMNEKVVMKRDVSAQKIKSSSDSLGLWPDQFDFESGPEKYNFSIFANVPAENKVGGFKFKYGSSNYYDTTLTISGVELAKIITQDNKPGRFQKNGLWVIPNPSRSYKKKEPVYVYFEIYNLPLKDNLSITFNLTYSFKLLKQYKKGIVDRVSGLFTGEKPQTAHTMERFSQSVTSVEYLALDMSHYDSGYYECEITVDLPVMNLKSSRKTEFELK
jgi:GWxTD domain-containing protein